MGVYSVEVGMYSVEVGVYSVEVGVKPFNCQSREMHCTIITKAKIIRK